MRSLEIASMASKTTSNPQEKDIDKVLMECDSTDWRDILFYADIVFLILGVLANATVLCLFLREIKSLSTSKVLGMNLVVMDLVYLSMKPFNLYFRIVAKVGNNSDSDVSGSAPQGTGVDRPIDDGNDVFSMFNLIGCPLLLACMCVERYLAVVRPVLYLRLRKKEYHVAVSGVWMLTLFFCMTTGLVNNLVIMMIPVSIIITCLFFIMLLCLGGAVWSLRQESPALSTHGTPTRSESPLKRRAVENLLFVVVSTVLSYLPVLFLVPVLICMVYWNATGNQGWCNAFEACLLFPRFGVLIGPLFYLSMARKMCCLKGTEG